jgi:hypothetical protein
MQTKQKEYLVENKQGKIQNGKSATASGYRHCLSCYAIHNYASQTKNSCKTYFLTSTAFRTKTKGSWCTAITPPTNNICFTLTCSSQRTA